MIVPKIVAFKLSLLLPMASKEKQVVLEYTEKGK